MTERALLSVIDRVPKRNGSALIRVLLCPEQGLAYTRSRAERRMKRLLQAAELPLARVAVL